MTNRNRIPNSDCMDCQDLAKTPDFVRSLMAVSKLSRVRSISRYHNNGHRVGTIHI